ncbi:MAG TPA: hypothetical protein VHX39_13000, partial [Acetobacteraceae bacterium]|nr:hypothetical protein [Acetobacteraceae bacterium]
MSLVRLQLLLLALLAVARPSLGAAPDDGGALQSWMLAQIQAGKDVDFNESCGTGKLDPHSTDDPRWSANCRSVDPDILRALLVRPGLADAAPHGVRLRGARVDGTLNLDDVHVTAVEFTLIDSSLAGDLILTTARLDGGLIIDNTVISGRLNAGTARIDRGIFIRNKTLIAGELGLDGTVIGDFLTLEDATLKAGMSATAVQISGGGFGLINTELDGDAMLVGARVHGLMGISGTKFKAGKQLNLTEAKIDGPVSIVNSEFGGDVNLPFTTVSEAFTLVGVTIAPGKQL